MNASEALYTVKPPEATGDLEQPAEVTFRSEIKGYFHADKAQGAPWVKGAINGF